MPSLFHQLPNYEDDYVVFGGTFDPIHEGHISVVRELLDKFKLVIIAPTLKNPWKQFEPNPLCLRREMIELVLAAENIPLFTNKQEKGVWIADLEYIYTEDLLKQLRQLLKGTLHWAVGEDSASGIHKWKDFEKLELALIIVKITIPVHATNIREAKIPIHPALRAFAKEHKLFT